MVEKKQKTWLQVQVWRTFAKLYEKKFNANNRHREGVKIFIREHSRGGFRLSQVSHLTKVSEKKVVKKESYCYNGSQPAFR